MARHSPFFSSPSALAQLTFEVVDREFEQPARLWRHAAIGLALEVPGGGKLEKVAAHALWRRVAIDLLPSGGELASREGFERCQAASTLLFDRMAQRSFLAAMMR